MREIRDRPRINKHTWLPQGWAAHGKALQWSLHGELRYHSLILYFICNWEIIFMGSVSLTEPYHFKKMLWCVWQMTEQVSRTLSMVIKPRWWDNCEEESQLRDIVMNRQGRVYLRHLVQCWFLIKIKMFTFDLILLNLVAFSIILLICMELVDHNGGIEHFQIFILVAGVKA